MIRQLFVGCMVAFVTASAGAQCCGDCNGDGSVNVNEAVAAIGNVLNGCSDAAAKSRTCPADSVRVGPICVDKYEASVWEIPASNTSLIERIRKGQIGTAHELDGAKQPDGPGDDIYGAACPKTAAGCKDDYAVSIPGVRPATRITWFQADAICRNSGKRLLTNAEWQRAAYGTPSGMPAPDDGMNDCNIYQAGDLGNAGSRSRCVSDVGAFDMVGNVSEWVADWLPPSAVPCAGWGAFSDDTMCLGVADDQAEGPVAPARGGHFGAGQAAGVFSIESSNVSRGMPSIGFRCGREL